MASGARSPERSSGADRRVVSQFDRRPLQVLADKHYTHNMDVIKYDDSESEIVRRILTAFVSQWDRMPNPVREALLRDACMASDPASATTSMREQIIGFIRKYGDIVRGHP
jgi:hypothetical protein